MAEAYEAQALLRVLFLTGIVGGGAACLAGRAIARTWRPLWHVLGYMVLLAAAVRFAHFALFEATLLSVPAFLGDLTFVVLIGALAWRVTRTTQMVQQYPWRYERSSPITWREAQR
jgi:hypothetical protein